MNFDFLDDNEDSYILERDPLLDQEEIEELPLSLAAINVSSLPLKHTSIEDYQAIVQLADPLHLFTLQSILHVLIQGTFELQIVEIPDEDNRPIDPIIDIKVLHTSRLYTILSHPFIDLVLGKILPLFGIGVFKSPRKAGFTHYALRYNGKMMRVSQLLVIINDLSLIFAEPKAISLDEIIHRWLLTAITSITYKYHDNNEYNDLWSQLSTYQIIDVTSSLIPSATTTITTANHSIDHKPRSLQTILDQLLSNITIDDNNNTNSTTPPASDQSQGIVIKPTKRQILIYSIPAYCHGEVFFLAPFLALKLIETIRSYHDDSSKTIECSQNDDIIPNISLFKLPLVELIDFSSAMALDNDLQEAKLSEGFLSKMNLSTSSQSQEEEVPHDTNNDPQKTTTIASPQPQPMDNHPLHDGDQMDTIDPQNKEQKEEERDIESPENKNEVLTSDDHQLLADAVATTISYSLTKQLFTTPYASLLCYWAESNGY